MFSLGILTDAAQQQAGGGGSESAATLAEEDKGVSPEASLLLSLRLSSSTSDEGLTPTTHKLPKAAVSPKLKFNPQLAPMAVPLARKKKEKLGNALFSHMHIVAREHVSVENDFGLAKVRFRDELYEVLWLTTPSPVVERIGFKTVVGKVKGDVILENGSKFENPPVPDREDEDGKPKKKRRRKSRAKVVDEAQSQQASNEAALNAAGDVSVLYGLSPPAASTAAPIQLKVAKVDQ